MGEILARLLLYVRDGAKAVSGRIKTLFEGLMYVTSVLALSDDGTINKTMCKDDPGTPKGLQNWSFSQQLPAIVKEETM